MSIEDVDVEDLHKTGVYKIVNLINNKFYIGSTKDSFYKRFYYHLHQIKRNIHHSNYLQKSVNKYGIDNFKFQIIEICSNTVEREQYYIDNLKPEYNLSPLAISSKGTIRTNLTKSRISKSLLGNKNALGVKRTEEQKRAISVRMSNLSKEERSRRGEKKAENSKILIYCLDETGNILKSFKSVKDASIFYDIDRTCIYDVLNGVYKWSRIIINNKKIKVKWKKEINQTLLPNIIKS